MDRKEVAAPNSANDQPDTGQVVLTPETRVTRTVDLEPSMYERLVMAVWRIRSLHLCRMEAQDVYGQMTYNVVWEHVYGMPHWSSRRSWPRLMTTWPSMELPATCGTT